MYLLMLLATFVSAIYGYNLSARPDYDRDVAKKKAMAVIYKFIFQENAAHELAIHVKNGLYKDTYGLQWVLSGDKIYGKSDNDEAFIYAQVDKEGKIKKEVDDDNIFYQRKNKGTKPNDVVKGVAPNDDLGVGRHFFVGDDMVSRVLCLDKSMSEADAMEVGPQTEEGIEGITGTNCKDAIYLVSYKKLDARWVNRIHLGVSLDFMNAIAPRRYSDNIGVISWNNTQQQWEFQGKINFEPVYAKEKREYEQKWLEEHPDATVLDDSFIYPLTSRERTTWSLPKDIFGQNFFTNKSGEDICKRGCLFNIKFF